VCTLPELSRPSKKETMSKLDCVVYLKSKLHYEFTRLTAGPAPDRPAAQRVQRLVLTAANISDGFFVKIEPLFDPVTPKFLLTVKALNEAIIRGTAVADFDEYITLLVAALQA
jgi:hypothetical protein